MLAAIITLCLAPVPRPIERLNPELIPGVWEARWGGTPAWFSFTEDGEYLYGCSGAPPSHIGRWEIRNGELWMLERCIGGTSSTEYTIGELSLVNYPRIVGRCRGGFQNPVTLFSPKRFDD